MFIKVFTIFVLVTIISLVVHYQLKLSSFYTSLFAFFLVIFIFIKSFLKAKHLIPFLILKSLFASFVSSFVHIIGYMLAVFILKEDWISNVWILDNISFKVLINNNFLVPLDDFIWFFIYSSLISIIPELLLKPKSIILKVQ